MKRTITYAVHQEDGLVISRVGSEFAWPVLEYDKMGPENNFEASYHLERIPIYRAFREWPLLKCTKKIPVPLKNKHRAFWGMKPIGGAR